MKSLKELEAIRDRMRAQIDNRDATKDGDTIIRVGMATCGISAGARGVMSAFLQEVGKRELSNIKVMQTGCVGICKYEPMADVIQNGQTVTYINLTPEKAALIVAEHIVNGRICTQYTVGREE